LLGFGLGERMTIRKKLREEERKECNEGLVWFVGVDGRGVL